MNEKTRERLRDLQTYGGLAMACVGAYVQFGVGASILLVGSAFWYIGVFRMSRRR